MAVGSDGSFVDCRSRKSNAWQRFFRQFFVVDGSRQGGSNGCVTDGHQKYHTCHILTAIKWQPSSGQSEQSFSAHWGWVSREMSAAVQRLCVLSLLCMCMSGWVCFSFNFYTILSDGNAAALAEKLEQLTETNDDNLKLLKEAIINCRQNEAYLQIIHVCRLHLLQFTALENGQ